MVKKSLFFFCLRRGERGRVFAVFFAPFPEKGILAYISHRPIIQVFTVVLYANLSHILDPIVVKNNCRLDLARTETGQIVIPSRPVLLVVTPVGSMGPQGR